MSVVYVIIPDNGYEGLGEPIAAFTREGDANRQAEILHKASYRSIKVFAVQMLNLEQDGSGVVTEDAWRA